MAVEVAVERRYCVKRIAIALVLAVSGCAVPGSAIIDCHQAESKETDPISLRVVVRLNRIMGQAALLSAVSPPSPIREGTVKASDSEYEIEFPNSKGGARVRLKVNRYSGQGTYEVGNEETVQNYFGLIQCKPYNSADHF